MSMSVTIGGDRVELERSVFVELLGNSVVNGRAGYQRALEKSTIPYSDLVELARKAQVPHPLFFASPELVREQVLKKNEKLLQGVAPETFTINTRTTVSLRDVELIVKDLLRKQALAKKYDPSLGRNRIVGLLKRSSANAASDAGTLLQALSLDRANLRRARTKEAALEMLIAHLEEKQVLVSRSVRGFMPQLIEVKFSGMTVRDARVPYIFLAGGDHGDFEEPVGRQIFTLVLMTVLVARGVFAPVTYDANSTSPNPGSVYEIAGEILMPAHEMKVMPLDDLDEIKAAANAFKVTPSAITVRAMHLGIVPRDVGFSHLESLKSEFESRSKPLPRQPKPVNAVRKYSGRALTARMLSAVDDQRLTAREFCRVVCLNRIAPSDLSELRAALK